MKILTIFSLISYLSFPALAYQPSEGNVTAYAGFFGSQSNFSSNQASNSQMGGAALVANGDLNDKGSLEIGLFYLNKLYLREQSGLQLIEQAGLVHVTMGYRRWLSDIFSASLSLSTMYPIGEVQVVHNDFPANSGVETSARDTADYGADLAFTADFFKHETWNLVSEARYSFLFTKRDGEKADHYGVLIGIRTTIQEKY